MQTIHAVTRMADAGIRLTSYREMEMIDLTSPHGELVLSVFAFLAKQERSIKSERAKRGIEIARANGVRIDSPAQRTRGEGSTLFNHGSSPPWTIRRKGIQGDADLEVSEDRPEWVRILQRFLLYSGVGILASSITALAIRFWLPESSHMPLFVLVHSLCVGVALMSVIRFGDRARTGPG